MKYILSVGMIGTISMALVLGYGFIYGDFFKDGGELLQNPWGLVSMVDLYVGFFIFTIFIFYKSNTILEKVIWFILMMVFGFFTGAIYVLIYAIKAKGDINVFFQGAKK